MNKPTLKERFLYWFDRRISKGSLTLIKFLIVISILVAAVFACLILLLGFSEDGAASVFWESFVTLINAWMPSFEDGSPGYIIVMALIAIAGVLFTSVLIGIVTSAIEEKILDLKKGNTRVLEENHIVLLGFHPGEYELLRQLILAAGTQPECIVIAEDTERDEMEASIKENIDLPNNVRLVCRMADITDPASLEKCSINTCRTIVITPTDDIRTVKAILAVTALKRQEKYPNVPVLAMLTDPAHRLPDTLQEKYNITALQTNNTLAKMIAHSCMQPGLSETFKEVFRFEGCDFYIVSSPGISGMSFEELTARMDQGVPAGIVRNGEAMLNPPAGERFADGDQLLVFSAERDSARILPEGGRASETGADGKTACNSICDTKSLPAEPYGTVLIIGMNQSLSVILSELPQTVSRIIFIVSCGEEKREEVRLSAADRGIAVEWADEEAVDDETVLLSILQRAGHVIILNDHEAEEEEADLAVIFRILRLRDLRIRHDLDFNITAEMRRESNEILVSGTDSTDFVVASNMSSLVLAQLAENLKLLGVFREILSNDGNELYQKTAEETGLAGTHTVRDLRLALLSQGSILLGVIKDGEYRFNPSLTEQIELGDEDSLILLSEDL